MSSPDEFSNNLYTAAEQKVLWLDSVALPKLLEEYRNYHSVIKNTIAMLLKKGLIIEDPYKHEKKIVDINIPDNTDFKDSETAAILGTRLSDYEGTLDFLCNYINFTVESLSLERIKKLMQLNSFILWNSLSNAGTRSNSRVLGVIFSTIKMSADSLSVGLVNNIVSVAAKSLRFINAEFKVLIDIQKELYKIEIRKTILDSPSFASKRESLTSENGVSQIRKVFPSLMGKNAFYPELIEEIVQEEVGLNSQSLKQTLLDKFSVAEQKNEKKENEVDTKAMLLSSVRALGAFSPQFDVVIQKIDENHNLLQDEHKGAWAKFIGSCRKAFGLTEKPIHYKIKIADSLTQSTKSEDIDYLSFVGTLSNSSRLYASLPVKVSANYRKVEAMADDAILEYVQKKINECQSLYVTLIGLDKFFKEEVSAVNRSKVKGLKMELTAIKNTIMKINQSKAEYVSFIAEQEQLKKLGITNE